MVNYIISSGSLHTFLISVAYKSVRITTAVGKTERAARAVRGVKAEKAGKAGKAGKAMFLGVYATCPHTYTCI
jgi:hypothetical protein